MISAGNKPADGTNAPSGYRLDHVYFLKLAFEGMAASPELPTQAAIAWSLGWDWRILHDREFEVMLTTQVSPTAQRPEKLDAVVVGRFAVQGDSPPPLAIPRFVLLGAPMLLFPFVREAIANLTGRGLLGSLFLDPVNLPAVLGSMDLGRSTAAGQIRENPDLSHGYGDRDVLLGLKKIQPNA